MTQQDSCEETTGSEYLRREGPCGCVWRWEMWREAQSQREAGTTNRHGCYKESRYILRITAKTMEV